MISLIIPTAGNNQDYTEYTINSIRQYYPNENEVEIILQEDSTITLGINYNNAVAKAKGEKIILLHNDMVMSKGFIETMDKHIQKGRITTYTRIEPPIYNDTYPGKVILDCGSDLKTFNKKKFEEHIPHESLIDGGSQLFFGCMKEDYIGIDGYTFKMFCEDDDLHLRYKLAGFEHKVSSAHVYHFVSKTSRTKSDSREIENQSNINFIKKWGFRNSQYNKCYKKSYSLINPNPQLEAVLEPWFNNGRDIIVKINGNTFNEYDYQIIQQLNDIIADNGDIGEFKLNNLDIIINSLDTFEKDLIYLKNN
jgi:hypothetical protein